MLIVVEDQSMIVKMPQLYEGLTTNMIENHDYSSRQVIFAAALLSVRLSCNFFSMTTAKYE